MKSRLLPIFAAIMIGAPTVALASEAYSPAKPNSPAVARKHGDPAVSTARKQARAADRALAKRVRKSIAKDHALDQARVVVFAKGGAVTLTGEVADEPQIALAEKRASTVPGVTSVNNQLTLSEGGS
ncbi:BON domain-containing protein [Burkholderia sp. Ac-20344]|uniref:BON domain-containing protein n=1 Tax=Burkholderia sp. Ac-20344 TaxID=2703890 RepID=UPI00197C4E83|nr:BON domain-containing protein [Burkholderia sp. Ac-20344]MBN3830320.1 BON domain-containing protein [Burkholderia sp. Ac-20344]